MVLENIYQANASHKGRERLKLTTLILSKQTKAESSLGLHTYWFVPLTQLLNLLETD